MAQPPRGTGPTKPEPTDAGEYAAVGLQFAAGILLFTFLGSWLDGRLGTAPWLLMIGVFAGFGLSLLWIYRKLVILPRSKELERKEREARERGEGP